MGALWLRTTVLRRLEYIFLMILIVTIGTGLRIGWVKYDGQERLQAALQLLPFPTALSELKGTHVGLVAGHAGHDSGAICPDGLQEVDVNAAVADYAAERLRQSGARVDVLSEFDPRLVRYQADALVSIHTDSCVSFSGFKVARAASSRIPAVEDRLVACLYAAYGAASGLPRHDSTITVNMTDYHAFRVIAPETPAAIIELGFLGGDRQLLTQEQARLGAGVAEGVRCFLMGDAAPTPVGP